MTTIGRSARKTAAFTPAYMPRRRFPFQAAAMESIATDFSPASTAPRNAERPAGVIDTLPGPRQPLYPGMKRPLGKPKPLPCSGASATPPTRKAAAFPAPASPPGAQPSSGRWQGSLLRSTYPLQAQRPCGPNSPQGRLRRFPTRANLCPQDESTPWKPKPLPCSDASAGHPARRAAAFCARCAGALRPAGPGL